jgi:ABC-type oligopeptide transport system substrate-binding subunit
MTPKQDRILSTLVYFLERYKKASIKNESSTGFEDIVFDQMIDTVKELKDENKRLSQLNKPEVLKGGLKDEID